MPKEVVGDSAYDTKELRAYLKRGGVKANIDVNVRNRRKPKGGRSYRLDGRSYGSMRSAVERFFAWIKSVQKNNHKIRNVSINIPSIHTSSMHTNTTKGFQMNS